MTDTWQDHLDTIHGAVTALDALGIDDTDAEKAAAASAKVERRLFFWRRGVEAAYLARYGDVPNLVAAAAMQDDVPQVQVLGQLIKDGALVPVWWKLDKYMVAHGVSLYPGKLETKEASNGSDNG